jgi:hypothetical protein
VTGGDSWFALQFQHFAKLAVSPDDVPHKARQLIGTSKFVFIVMWGVDSFHIVNFMIS